MLRISKLADYGTLLLTYMAQQPMELQGAKNIASNTYLPLPTVSKLLKILVQAKFLESTRGAHGGYRLACSAEEISIAQLIEAIDGTISVTQCSDTTDHCNLAENCHVGSNWRILNKAIYAALDSVSLADMLRPTLQVSKVNLSQIKGLNRQTACEESL